MIPYSNCEKNGFLPVFPPPKRHRKLIAFIISVIILCVVIIISVLATTGVFKKNSSPAQATEGNGNNGIEVRRSLADE
jgi:uncharacterized protein YpmB